MSDLETTELTVTKIVDATPARAFEAWTNPDQIVKWWGDGDVTCPAAEVDLTVGGMYRIANSTPEGHTMWITGSYTHIEPPHRLRYTWTMEPVLADSQYSVVDVTFVAVGRRTEVTVHQQEIADAPTREMHHQGWLGCLSGLERLLAA